MFDILQLSFFQNALFAGLLASLVCGIIGSYVVIKKVSSISGGLAHAAFGGVGIGYFFGFSPLLGAAGFSIFSALIIGFIYRFKHHSLDTLVSMVWAFGMAVGVIFIGLKPGYAPDLMTYLFGSILFIPNDYILFLAILDLVVIFCVVTLFPYFQAVSFDEEFSEISGVAVGKISLLLLTLTALSIVMLIKVVGVILVIALLTIPAVIAEVWSKNLKMMMVVSVILSSFCTVGGLFLSYELSSLYNINLATGPLIILLALFCFVISSFLREKLN